VGNHPFFFMSNAFEAEIVDSAAALGLLYTRLPIPLKPGLEGRVIKLKTNPYDGFLIHRGVHFGLEMKSKEEHGTFSFSAVEENQVEGLKKVLSHGGRSFLLVNMRRSPNAKGKMTSDNQAWALDFSKWDGLVASTTYKNGKPKKSIGREVFDNPEWFTSLPRISYTNFVGKKSLIWDLRVLLPEVMVVYPTLPDSFGPLIKRRHPCAGQKQIESTVRVYKELTVEDCIY
jgi:penicillin-binding protein-related factor A (putative recombinase)